MTTTIILEISERPAGNGTELLTQLFVRGPAAPGVVPVPGSPRAPTAATAVPITNVVNGEPFDPEAIRRILLETTVLSPELAKVGRQLYALLHHGPVAAEWDRLAAGRERLRVEFAIAPGRLRLWPWELMRSPIAPLFLDPGIPIARAAPATAHDDVGPARPWPWPLRVLIVVGAKPKDPAVLAEHEVGAVQQAARADDRLIDLEVLWAADLPSRRQLIDAIREHRPHVLHFIGHGTGGGADGAALRFEVGPGQNWNWDRQAITTDLRAIAAELGWLPRLAILNACRSGATAAPAGPAPATPGVADATGLVNQEVNWSIAETFNTAGVPAVLAMQADVPGKTAGMYSESLYANIAGRTPLDQAVASARARVAAMPGVTEARRDPYLATLSLSLPPDQIFPITPHAAAPVLARIAQCTHFAIVKEFVDGVKPRREITRGLSPFDGRAPASLLVVCGVQRSGKSSVIHWCMEGLARQGHQIRYLEVRGRSAGDWLDVLCALRDGDPTNAPGSLVLEPLPPAAFDRFNRALKRRLAGGEAIDLAGAPSGGAPEPPESDGQRRDRTRITSDKFPQQTCADFLEALAAAGKADGPLTIVLDHFNSQSSTLLSEHFKVLWLNVFQRVANGSVPGVRFVLVIEGDETRGEFKDYGLKQFRPLFQEVTLQDLPPDQFPELAAEYMRRKLATDDDAVPNLIKFWGAKRVRNGRWSISTLAAMYDVYLSAGG